MGFNGGAIGFDDTSDNNIRNRSFNGVAISNGECGRGCVGGYAIINDDDDLVVLDVVVVDQ